MADLEILECPSCKITPVMREVLDYEDLQTTVYVLACGCRNVNSYDNYYRESASPRDVIEYWNDAVKTDIAAAKRDAEDEEKKKSIYYFVDWLSKQKELSYRILGPGKQTSSKINSIIETIGRLQNSEHELAEWIHIAVLALDEAIRCGPFTAEQVAAKLSEKQKAIENY